ncbi:MAG: hypothetical protein ACREP5_15625, partial [Candidatus Binatia bacterium]
VTIIRTSEIISMPRFMMNGYPFQPLCPARLLARRAGIEKKTIGRSGSNRQRILLKINGPQRNRTASGTQLFAK